MRIRVYRNLHRGGYSIMCMEPGDHYMKIIDHVESISLCECFFIVREAGAKKAKTTGVRNVHAFVEGYRCEPSDIRGTPERITYEPFGSNRFVIKSTGEFVDEASYVHLDNLGAYAFF